MSDPLTDAANAISTSSPKVRAFAQLAAQRIEAIEARLTPTPPPASGPASWDARALAVAPNSAQLIAGFYPAAFGGQAAYAAWIAAGVPLPNLVNGYPYAAPLSPKIPWGELQVCVPPAATA